MLHFLNSDGGKRLLHFFGHFRCDAMQNERKSVKGRTCAGKAPNHFLPSCVISSAQVALCATRNAALSLIWTFHVLRISCHLFNKVLSPFPREKSSER